MEPPGFIPTPERSDSESVAKSESVTGGPKNVRWTRGATTLPISRSSTPATTCACRSFATDRQQAHAMPAVLGDHHSACRQRLAAFAEDAIEPRDHVLRARVPKAKHHDRRFRAPRQRNDLSEVEIESQNDSVFGCGLREDIAVRHLLQPLIAKMNHVFSAGSEPFDHA